VPNDTGLVFLEVDNITNIGSVNFENITIDGVQLSASNYETLVLQLFEN
jgi:hypothetical protein